MSFYLILCALAAVTVLPSWGSAAALLLFSVLAASGISLIHLLTPPDP